MTITVRCIFISLQCLLAIAAFGALVLFVGLAFVSIVRKNNGFDRSSAMDKGDVNREMGVQAAPLFVPHLEDLALVIAKVLSTNYSVSSCAVVECPDLTKPPFDLAAPGICGNTRLVEIGGVPNLVPEAKYSEKVYDFEVRSSMHYSSLLYWYTLLTILSFVVSSSIIFIQ